MTIVVNGTPRQIPDRASVATLLVELKLDQRACAVEVNRTIVPKPRHPEHVLAEGDRVEIVTLVGGG
ncbi:MAG: sulfur carrier protein ThiS [Phycisphaerales bacterium]